MWTLLLALQLGVAPVNVSTPALQKSDSVVRFRADSATREFLSRWREAWEDSQLDRPKHTRSEITDDSEMRLLAVHCHWMATPWWIRTHVIKGAGRTQASCPIWYPTELATPEDERRYLDAGISRDRRAVIQARRQQLRLYLDSLARQLPGDLRLTRQRVRFALDAGDLGSAWGATAQCARTPGPCGMLQGLLLYRAGNIAGADSTFAVATALMPEVERCAWNDVGVLLGTETRQSYRAMTCEERAQLEARLWWLADPLYLEPGNERRAEHYARKVLITFVSAYQMDERQHWQVNKGGDAVAEALIRYGWPTQMYWAGSLEDEGHDNWLSKYKADTSPPYVAGEYTRDRLHTLPRDSTLTLPFAAKPDAWQLNAPPSDDDWWPVEHFARDASRIVQLPVGQSVMLRRRDATRVVWAGDLDAKALARKAGDDVRATLFQSREVDRVASVEDFAGRVGRPLVIDAPLAAGPALLSIELPGDSARAAARTRFGTTIVESLAALAGTRALSQPLLIEPPTDAAMVLDADAAVHRMYGATTFANLRRIGVYWEGYGFSASDTLDVSVQMTREDRPGFFFRLAGFLRLAPQEGGRVNIQWREAPGSGRAIQRMEGNVPVQMRSMVLDVSRLPTGTYRLALSMGSAGGTAVSSDRVLVLRK